MSSEKNPEYRVGQEIWRAGGAVVRFRPSCAHNHTTKSGLEYCGAQIIADEKLPGQMDRSQWPAFKERLAAIFKTKTREQWCEVLEGSDVCFAPVLSLSETKEHPHMQARETFVTVIGGVSFWASVLVVRSDDDGACWILRTTSMPETTRPKAAKPWPSGLRWPPKSSDG